jgi:glyoxylase-like metal-dependent hydrolase (beta-lactamase superfamily II)
MSHVYLIPCRDGYLQIDTGYEHDYSIYRRNLARAGIALESVRIFCSHHHDDHAGFLNDLTGMPISRSSLMNQPMSLENR